MIRNDHQNIIRRQDKHGLAFGVVKDDNVFFVGRPGRILVDVSCHNASSNSEHPFA
jgi:hypothetical protein